MSMLASLSSAYRKAFDRAGQNTGRGAPDPFRSARLILA